MIELFKTDHVLVRSVPTADTSRWVVTFDNFGLGPGFDRPGFGQGFLEAAGISAIHVMGVGDDWYQYPEMTEALAAVRQAVQGAERVMTYGSSMGGYAALRFAEAAGAQAVLALSPQYSINPLLAPFETRWTQAAGRIQWQPALETRMQPGRTNVVAYDPRILDQQHIQLIRQEIPLREIRLPYSGHPAGTCLQEQGLLKGLVFETLAGTLDEKAFESLARSRRGQSPHYLSQLAEAQPEHRQTTALALAQRACDLAPANPLAQIYLARIQSRSRRFDEALKTIRRVMADSSLGDEYQVQFAEILAEAGQLDEAIEVASGIVERAPDLAHLVAWKGHLHWRRGEVELGMDLLQQARLMDPNNPHFDVTAEAYQEAAQALAQAEAQADAANLASADAKMKSQSGLWRRLLRALGRGQGPPSDAQA